mmetsp:Transcript_15424/g.18786  ORF Transcript_15424/g.18786 Transcript_15424/m.18786 type:complete len:531 (+) Transcript_15424:160-1752(+)
MCKLFKVNNPCPLILTIFSILHFQVRSTESFTTPTGFNTKKISSLEMTMTTTAKSNSSLQVAIIGAGAAGLATARTLSKRGINVCVFEKENQHVGGVWAYENGTPSKPMYRGLRTNLPREIMAFREKKWGGDGISMSYVTHEEVKDYLNEYSNDFNLKKFISFGSSVKQLTICQSEKNDIQSPYHNTVGTDSWPRVELEWEKDNKMHHRTFDSVCVCNGHYAVPSSPHIPGIEHFKGKIMHSIEYDNPAIFKDQVVLCVGGRASGSDLAREISEHASKVYLSDTSCPMLDNGQPVSLGNVNWVPKTLEIDEESRIQFGGSCAERPNDIDVIIFCSGYDYQFPFINSSSNLELTVTPGERRISPLYEQLWHARYPKSIAFVGLQHSVVPFPFFEFQAEAIANQILSGNDDGDESEYKLPQLQERLDSAERDASSGGPKDPGRVQDTHYLGSYQWDHFRLYARYGGILNDCIEKYISTNKAIYDNSNQSRKGIFPGGPDEYRYYSYVRDDENESFRVVHLHEKAKVAANVSQ